MNKKYDFEPGSLISIDDSKYIVVRNYGNAGLIKECGNNGALINHFRWNNESIIKIADEKISEDELEQILQELHSFF